MQVEYQTRVFVDTDFVIFTIILLFIEEALEDHSTCILKKDPELIPEVCGVSSGLRLSVPSSCCSPLIISSHA